MALCPYCDKELGWFEKAHGACVNLYKQKALEAERARLQTQQEQERERVRLEAEERTKREYELWRTKHSVLVSKFLDIAERKVSVLDDYGDEKWEALGKEIEILLTKTAKNDNEDLNSVKRWLFKPIKLEDRRRFFRMLSNQGSLLSKYFNLKARLKSEFEVHHENCRTGNSSGEFEGLTGQEFETHLARMLAEHGFEDIRGTPTTGDQGADLIASRSGRTIVIQAKRYEGSVGNRAVQEVAGAVNFYGADEGWVVTSGSFTQAAKALAQKNNVTLVDGHALRRRLFPSR